MTTKDEGWGPPGTAMAVETPRADRTSDGSASSHPRVGGPELEPTLPASAVVAAIRCAAEEVSTAGELAGHLITAAPLVDALRGHAPLDPETALGLRGVWSEAVARLSANGRLAADRAATRTLESRFDAIHLPVPPVEPAGRAEATGDDHEVGG